MSQKMKPIITVNILSIPYCKPAPTKYQLNTKND